MRQASVAPDVDEPRPTNSASGVRTRRADVSSRAAGSRCAPRTGSRRSSRPQPPDRPTPGRRRASRASSTCLGFGAIRLVAASSLLVGLITVFQAAYQLAPYGAEVVSARALAWFVAREIGPDRRRDSCRRAERGGNRRRVRVDERERRDRRASRNGTGPGEVPRRSEACCAADRAAGADRHRRDARGRWRMARDVGRARATTRVFTSRPPRVARASATSVSDSRSPCVFASLIGIVAADEGLRVERRVSAIGAAATRSVVYCLVGVLGVDTAVNAFVYFIPGAHVTTAETTSRPNAAQPSPALDVRRPHRAVRHRRSCATCRSRSRAVAVTCVLGPMHSGKSLLLRLILGLERAEHGTVTIDGSSFDAARPNEDRPAPDASARRRRVRQLGARVATDDARERRACRSSSTRRVDADACARHGRGAAARRRRHRRHGAYTGSSLTSRSPANAALARALVLEPAVLLDRRAGQRPRPARRRPSSMTRCARCSERYRCGMLICSQEVRYAFHWPNAVSVLADGRIVEQGSLDDLLNSRHEAVRRFVDRRGAA